MNTMYRPRRSVGLLIVCISGISALAWFANTYTPDSWQTVITLFTLITVIITSLLLYFLNNVRHILIITGGIVVLLILRYWGLREIIYPMLLMAVLFSLELMLRKR